MVIDLGYGRCWEIYFLKGKGGDGGKVQGMRERCEETDEGCAERTKTKRKYQKSSRSLREEGGAGGVDMKVGNGI